MVEQSVAYNRDICTHTHSVKVRVMLPIERFETNIRYETRDHTGAV